jgi:hypothetical protein
MHEQRSALLESATIEQVKAIGAKLHELAVGGDVGAVRLWLECCVGRPAQQVELAVAEEPDIENSREELARIFAALRGRSESIERIAERIDRNMKGYDAQNLPDDL